MPAKTFSKQFLAILKTHFETNAPLEQLEKAKKNDDNGYVTRVFNDLKLTLSDSELKALLAAREESLVAFASVISQQIEPIVKQMFDEGKPTLFEKLYETYFKDTKTLILSKEAIQEKIIQAILEQYGESVVSTIPSDNAALKALIGNAIQIVTPSITTPQTVKKLARFELDNPDFQNHLETIKNGEIKSILMRISPIVEQFESILSADIDTLRTIIPQNEQIKTLISLMTKLYNVIDRNIDPDLNIAETLPESIREFPKIRGEIEALTINGEPDKNFVLLRGNTLESLGHMNDQFSSNLQDLTLAMIDLKFSMPFSKLFKSLDSQLETLERLVDNNEVLLRENSALAQHAKIAVNTITELKRTLLKDADDVPADNLATAVPQLTQKILTLNGILQKTLDDLAAELLAQKTQNTLPLIQGILSALEPVLKAVGDFMAWCGYVSEGTAKRQLKENVATHLTTSRELETQLSKVSLTNKNSPAVLTNPRNNASRNLAADFQRAMANEELFVNEKALSEYAEKYNEFKEKSDVLRFFEEVLLQNVSGSKTHMVQYLEAKFHQDGLLLPVTSSIQTAMTEYNAQTGKSYLLDTIRSNTLTKKVALVTNSTGFTVKEQMKVGTLFVFHNSFEKGKKNPLYELSEDKTTLSAEIEGSPILAAQGTVQVDFSQNPAEPTLTALENTITYGHRALAEKMEILRENRPGSDAVSDGDFTDGDLTSEDGAEIDDEKTYEDARKKLRSSHKDEPETDDEDDDEYYDTNTPHAP